MQPWDLNTVTTSQNDYWDFNEGGYTRLDISAQYHTHPSSSGISRNDAIKSADFNIPVYSLGKNGNMWKVSFQKDGMVPIYFGPYGLSLIHI